MHHQTTLEALLWGKTELPLARIKTHLCVKPFTWKMEKHEMNKHASRTHLMCSADMFFFSCKSNSFYTKTCFETEVQGSLEMAYCVPDQIQLINSLKWYSFNFFLKTDQNTLIPTETCPKWLYRYNDTSSQYLRETKLKSC